MKQIYIIISLLTSLAAFSQSINQEQSVAKFEIGYLAFGSADGTIGGMTGSIKFDPNNLKTALFDVCIDPATVDTDNNKRNEHLVNEDFFYVEKYPTICFKSSSVKASGDGYIAYGTLTLHGITRKIELPFTYSAGKFIGHIEVNRFDYDLGEEAYSSTVMVGETAEIEITCVID